MKEFRKSLFFIFLIVSFSAFSYLGKRHWMKLEKIRKEHSLEGLVEKLDQSANSEWCDKKYKDQRFIVATTVDKFRKQIDVLWQKQKPSTEEAKDTIALGPIFIKHVPPPLPGVEFDRTVWNWTDTYLKLQDTQLNQREKDWMDLDTATQFLARSDRDRILYGKKFLPPDEANQNFQPHPLIVARTGKKEFQVELNPGDFAGFEKTVEKMIEEEWRGEGYRVKVKWSQNPQAYVFRAANIVGRSVTNHQKRMILIISFSPYRTIAHEVGHVLGFDDHYYQVWHPEYCYYTQEYRTSDIMSDSSNGRVNKRHWEILDQAYPWKMPPAEAPFTYTYGKKD